MRAALTNDHDMQAGRDAPSHNKLEVSQIKFLDLPTFNSMFTKFVLQILLLESKTREWKNRWLNTATSLS